MKPFKYTVPTPIYFGQNCVKDNAKRITELGQRAYIITSKFAEGCTNYALEDVKEVLSAAGIKYYINYDVIENPPVESCVEIFKAARAFNPDFIIGIGGGSPIDTAKAVNLLLEYPDSDANELFFGGKGGLYDQSGREGLLPVIAIPTTAGTGAEVTAAAVITRNDVKTKEAIKHNLYCTAAFLDSRYIKESPAFLIHTGVLDALAHGMETYVNVKSNFYNRSLAEIGFKLFAEFKDNMLNDCLTDEDFDKMILSSAIDGMAMMQSGTTIPHGMGYPLSQFKHVNHGLSCSIFLGEYMRSFKDQTYVSRIVQMCGFKDSDEMSDFFAEIIKRDLTKLNCTTAEVEDWTQTFFNTQQSRFARHPEPLTIDDIRQIYFNSLKPYIEG